MSKNKPNYTPVSELIRLIGLTCKDSDITKQAAIFYNLNKKKKGLVKERIGTDLIVSSFVDIKGDFYPGFVLDTKQSKRITTRI